MKRFMLMVMLLSAVIGLIFAGCATTRGVGEDVKSVGQKIEDVAK
jgi:predicted small secreted protein